MGILRCSNSVKAKLMEEFKDKKVLDISLPLHPHRRGQPRLSDNHNHNITQFPWPLSDNTYDLVICQNVLQHLPDTAKTLEELNRITKGGGKVLIEAPHYTWSELHRHLDHCHRFSFGSFDYFTKGNPIYKTDFHLTDKYLFFDEIFSILGIGYLANLFPKQYEKRLAFIIPATSFQVTFKVDK